MADAEAASSLEQSPELAPSAAVDAPFDSPHADFIIRSADGADYRVVKAILAEASPVFHDMLSLPQPSANSVRTNDAYAEEELPVAQLPEKGEILEPLLRRCYPGVPPRLKDLRLIEGVLVAAWKYDMELVVQDMRKALQEPEFSDGEMAIKVYIIACRYKLETEARKAARDTLKSRFFQPYGVELEGLPIVAYYRLLQYHRDVAENVHPLFTGSPLNSLPPSLFPQLTCSSGKSGASLHMFPEEATWLAIDPPNPMRWVAGWWTHFRNRALEHLKETETPNSDEIFSWDFLFPSFHSSEECTSGCCRRASERWTALVGPLKEERDRRVSEVSLDLSWF